MEVDESFDLSSRCGIVIFLSLLVTQGFEHLTNCSKLVRNSRHARIPTSLLLHVPTLQTFVEKPNPKSDVHAHPLLVDLSGDSVLYKDIGGISTEFVTTIPYLSDDFRVPLPLRLTCSDESTHDNAIDLSPILTGITSEMGDNICIGAFVETRLMAERALANLNDMFFSLFIGQIVRIKEATVVTLTDLGFLANRFIIDLV